MKKQGKIRSMDLNQRKKELFRLLFINQKCTLEYLSNSLKVSKRTVKRYLDELEETVPLIFTTGRYSGGVQLANRPENRLILNNQELYVLEKVVSEIEQDGSCSLDTSELSDLKEILYRYSQKNL